MDLSIVVPAYNEEAVLEATLQSIEEYASRKFSSFEIIVVDDGSTDSTAALARRRAVKLIQYGRNRGKGYAVRAGVLESSGDLILFMDADNSTRITELDHFLEEIKAADMVIGSRALSASRMLVSQSALKRLVGRVGNKLIRTVLALPFEDTQCGFKLMRPKLKNIFRMQKIERWGFDFEILYLACRRGFKIYESPVTWVNNFDSKVSAWSYASVFFELVAVRVNYHLGKYEV